MYTGPGPPPTSPSSSLSSWTGKPPCRARARTNIAALLGSSPAVYKVCGCGCRQSAYFTSSLLYYYTTYFTTYMLHYLLYYQTPTVSPRLLYHYFTTLPSFIPVNKPHLCPPKGSVHTSSSTSVFLLSFSELLSRLKSPPPGGGKKRSSLPCKQTFLS
jgi:hypothetical protein